MPPGVFDGLDPAGALHASSLLMEVSGGGADLEKGMAISAR